VREILKESENIAKTMTWCELADTIMSMEYLLQEFKPFMTKKEIETHTSITFIYEQEKDARLKSKPTTVDYSKYLFDPEDISDDYY